MPNEYRAVINYGPGGDGLASNWKLIMDPDARFEYVPSADVPAGELRIFTDLSFDDAGHPAPQPAGELRHFCTVTPAPPTTGTQP